MYDYLIVNEFPAIFILDFFINIIDLNISLIFLFILVLVSFFNLVDI